MNFSFCVFKVLQCRANVKGPIKKRIERQGVDIFYPPILICVSGAKKNGHIET